MTARFETRMTFAVPAQRLFELVTDPEFQIRKAKHLGFDKVEVHRDDRDGEVVLTLDFWEPAHFGGGESRRTMTMRLDPNTLAGTWTQRVHGQEARVRAEGSTRIFAHGEQRCEIVTGGDIELKIPLIGKMIETKIKAGIEGSTEKEAAFTRAALARADPMSGP